tara:strand:- start:102 stop:287 length:186 start_codon:yes stop_codon:yes gene_type:complete
MKCKWCRGKGYLYVEQGSSLSYSCPDCYGSGEEPEEEECEECGEQVMERQECGQCKKVQIR